MSVDIILKDIEWDGVNKIRVPLEGGGTQDFSIGGGTATLQTKSKTYTPTASQQTESVQADNGYDGLDTVNITVNAMPSGTEGTPTATKGTVSNHSVTVTPSVTNSAGYISGGTKTGNAVTVTATELASGNLPITQNADNINVVGYSSVSVNVQGGTPTLQTKSKTYTPNSSTQTDSITFDSGYDGLDTVNITINPVDPKLVTGTFTTGSTAGYTNIDIPYTHSGYPIMCVVVVDGGAYKSGTDWYNSSQRYAIGQWTMTKANMSSVPTYTTSGTQNQGVTTWVFKNTSSTSYSRSSAMSTNVYSSSNASNSGANTIKLKSGNVLSYYVNTSSYGLHPNITYRYFIVYS